MYLYCIQAMGQLPQKKEMDEYVEGLAQKNVSGILAIAKGHDIQYQKTFCYAVQEKEKPYTLDTVFTVGSITKQFIAAAIVKLESEGKLSFSDTLSKYFKETPSDKEMITIETKLF